MKQKTAFSSLYGLLLLLSVSQLITSCSSKKAQQTKMKNIPAEYSIMTKAPSAVEIRMNYIDRYKAIAIREMERTGIPASIKLAQGLLESGAGQSELSSKYNNHFGIKCHSDWTGERFYKEDDDKDPVTGQLIKSCFRAYKNPEESFVAHSEFLRDPRKANRYGTLFQLDRRDYVGWAEGLERSGYATSKEYSEKLIRVIEDYQLSRFDGMNSGDLITMPNTNTNRPNNPSSGNPDFDSPFNKPTPTPSTNNPTTPSVSQPNDGFFRPNKEGVWNDTRYVQVNDRSTLEQVAGRYDVSLKKIMEYNEETPDPVLPLKEGTVIYLQKKRSTWRGESKYHRVKDCETMFTIAQQYGIKVSTLYERNEMRDGEQPAVGERILLRRGIFQKWDKPTLRDTFGEWRRCTPIDTMMNRPVVPQPSRPTAGTKPSNDFGFDIIPGQVGSGTSQPQSSYPSYPTTQPSYPTYPTSDVNPTNPTRPNTQPTNNNANNFPSNEPSYPSYPTNRPSEPTYPSYPTNQPANNNNNTGATNPPRPLPRPTTPATNPTPIKPVAGGQMHTVVQGETLWRISKIYNVTVDQLKAWNNLPDNTIKPGQQLRVK